MSRGGSGDRGPEAAAGQTIGAADRVPGAVDQVLGAAARWRAAGTSRRGAIVLAIDGHGAAGKSTIAEAVATATGAALVHTDDFFLAQPSRAGQPVRPGRPPPVPAMAAYYDWRRLRAQALEPLRARLGAAFRRFDWEHGSGLDGAVTVEPSDLILVEGVYSSAPELRDLVDRSVFVDTPEPERLRRLRGRVKPDEWDDQWLLAERAYFDVIRPPSSFDLIVSGADLPPELTRR
jgi:uridine kinase